MFFPGKLLSQTESTSTETLNSHVTTISCNTPKCNLSKKSSQNAKEDGRTPPSSPQPMFPPKPPPRTKFLAAKPARLSPMPPPPPPKPVSRNNVPQVKSVQLSSPPPLPLKPVSRNKAPPAKPLPSPPKPVSPKKICSTKPQRPSFLPPPPPQPPKYYQEIGEKEEQTDSPSLTPPLLAFTDTPPLGLDRPQPKYFIATVPPKSPSPNQPETQVQPIPAKQGQPKPTPRGQAPPSPVPKPKPPPKPPRKYL